MKNISAWAIRNPILPIVLFIVLGFIGVVAFVRLPINLNPDISFPVVNVRVVQPGAAPTEIEQQITQKIEGAVASVGNVRNISSFASEGSSTTSITFQIGTPIDRAVNDVRDATSKVRSELPEGVEEPLIQRVDAEGGPIGYFGVRSTAMTPAQLSWFVDNTVAKRLQSIPGVAQVFRGGGLDRELRVELDPARMQAYGITAVDVNRQLRTLNLDAPGGRAQLGGGEQAIRVLGSAHTAGQLAETQIPVSGNRSVRLGDIAAVYDGSAELRNLARLDGRPTTTFGISKSKGSSDVTVDDAVNAELDKIRAEFPGIEITRVFTTVTMTRTTYASAIDALLEGSLLAVLVVFVFLRDWRSTFISALAIPLSAIPTFAFMYFMDFTLNTISLLALALVAGVLVDDAIVEIENIVRHMRMGKTPFQAALDAADEIGLAVVATSATIIAVFLPVSFMGGVSGQYFKQFGLTVAAAVFFSLLVARLITPLIAAYMLKPHADRTEGDGPLMRQYLTVLRWCIDNRWKAIGGGTGFFAVAVLLMVLIPKSFVPPYDISASQLKLELPPGVQLDETARIAAQASAIVRAKPEVRHVIESVGSNDGDVRAATLYIALVQPSERRMSQREWEAATLKDLQVIPDARINFVSMNGGNGRDLTLYLTGEDIDLLNATANKVIDEMRTLPGLREPRIAGDIPRPELLIKPRLDLAAELGVSVSTISQAIRIATIGEIAQNAAKFSLADRQIPIRVSLREDSRRDLATIENMPVPTAAGGTVPLKAVADIGFGQGPTSIRRYNQTRRLSLEADLNGIELGTAMQQIYALPTMKNLPQGVRRVEVGEAEFFKELFSNFVLAIVSGVLMVLAVLVLLFARVFQPFTILSALPLSLGGAFIALILAGQPFSIFVVIGVLMLMGIVAKNSILLVDFAIEEMRAGRDRVTALMESGHKRARPIVMTTVAMVAGMAPVALGIGAGAQRAPMAIAVIGGLVTSTALTLVIVPAAFTLVDDIERWMAPRFSKLVVHAHATHAPVDDATSGTTAPTRSQPAG